MYHSKLTINYKDFLTPKSDELSVFWFPIAFISLALTIFNSVLVISSAQNGLPSLLNKNFYLNKTQLVGETALYTSIDIHYNSLMPHDIVIYSDGRYYSAGKFISVVNKNGVDYIAVTDNQIPDAVKVIKAERLRGKVVYQNQLLGKTLVAIKQNSFIIFLSAASLVVLFLFMPTKNPVPLLLY